MGNYSKFIKATGNCRIMISKIRKYQEERNVFLCEFESCEIYQDENGEEYTTLTEFGDILNGKLFGYLNFNYIRDFYVVYEAMSINGMECYPSKVKAQEQDRNCTIYDLGDDMFASWTRSGMRPRRGMKVTKTKGLLDRSMRFDNVEELKSFLIPFTDNPMVNEPIMKLNTKDLYDISMVTRSSEMSEYQDKKRRKRANDDESCKIYFVEEDDNYFYFEFLPYGEGINIAVADYYPNVSEISETWDENLMQVFSQSRDDCFSWSILTLQ